MKRRLVWVLSYKTNHQVEQEAYHPRWEQSGRTVSDHPCSVAQSYYPCSPGPADHQAYHREDQGTWVVAMTAAVMIHSWIAAGQRWRLLAEAAFHHPYSEAQS
jgi:hypothetical protein